MLQLYHREVFVPVAAAWQRWERHVWYLLKGLIMKQAIQELLKELPAVDEQVRALETGWGRHYPRWVLVQAVRDGVDELRSRILGGKTERAELDHETLQGRADTLLAPSLVPLFNATGVVVHTNLGRAPLSGAVMERVARIAAGYSNLEYDVQQRRRGSRHVHVSSMLRQLTGAEDAVVVNNNAAAVLICLSALAQGREVVVSRGELIEIGGSFRLPDVMAASGALLREVGTTNRTHVADYRGAIHEQTALLLKAHQSNFAVVGFTAEVDPAELVATGREAGVPTMFDLGSGSLLELDTLGLPPEMTVQGAVQCGFDLVTFSGDKLLGGPQAGIIVGHAAAVERIRTHPLMRPLRPDKMTLSALEATLEAYRDGRATRELPVPSMLAARPAELQKRARRLRGMLRRASVEDGWSFELTEVVSRVGGGALPLAAPPSWAVVVSHPQHTPDQTEALLREASPPVVARIEQERLLLDLRTVPKERLKEFAAVVARALRVKSPNAHPSPEPSA